MAYIFPKMVSCKSAVSRVLIATFLLMTLFPYHFHLHHHELDTASHTVSTDHHEVEFHTAIKANLSDHHPGDHTVDSATDLVLKSNSPQIPFAVLLLAFVLTLPLVLLQVHRYALETAHRIPRLYRHQSPPLRAPPQS